MYIPFFLNMSGGEIFVILLFILIFFGSKRIPEFARSLGKGMREVKNATDSIKKEITGSVRDVEREIYENRRNFTEEIDKTLKDIDPADKEK
ncbi:MAG: twin-arginine translocase TatA/TatE family subunit [Bacteroidia bacterium]|nr:twin-arginine translocase TatA/TatE family subunit [Bacteroidia bacterium]